MAGRNHKMVKRRLTLEFSVGGVVHKRVPDIFFKIHIATQL